MSKIKELFKKIKPILLKVLKVLLIIICCWFSLSYLYQCKNNNKLKLNAQVEVKNTYSFAYSYNDNLILSKNGTYSSNVFNNNISFSDIIFNCYWVVNENNPSINNYYISNITGKVTNNVTYASTPTTTTLTTLSTNTTNFIIDFGTSPYLLESNDNLYLEQVWNTSNYYSNFKLSYLKSSSTPTWSYYANIGCNITWSAPSITWFNKHYQKQDLLKFEVNSLLATSEQISSYDVDEYYLGQANGINKGIDEVQLNPNKYNLYTYEQYSEYGYDEYTRGYQDAEELVTPDLASNGFKTLFSSILNAPYNILHGTLNFEIFGLNMFGLFSFCFSVVIVFGLFKIIKG